MIKKAILLLLAISFLMMFSNYALANTCAPYGSRTYTKVELSTIHGQNPKPDQIHYRYTVHDLRTGAIGMSGACTVYRNRTPNFDFYLSNPLGIPPKTNEECERFSGSSVPLSYSSSNYLTSGGSVHMGGGTCSVTGTKSVCDDESCTVTLQATSTGEAGEFQAFQETDIDLRQASDPDLVQASDNDFKPTPDFESSTFLHELPGSCTDSANCVNIGDTSFLVDWDAAPDYFSYVDSSGITHSKPSSNGGSTGGGSTDGGSAGDGSTGDGSTGGGSTGGGSTGDGSTDGGSTDGGSTGGGSTGGGSTGGGSTGGGSTGGGSTVPEFELDESAIIAAIESAGRANQNAIRALSNDTMGKIDQQTDTLNATTNAQTNALNSTIAAQTDTFTQSLDDRSSNLSRQLDDQKTLFSAAFDSLGNTLTDAINRFEADEESNGEENGEGLLDAIPGLLNSLVDNLAGRFTEQVGEGDDLLNTAGIDTTLDGLNEQETQHGEDVKTLMDEIGDGASSSIADQITSRLPSLPSGGCVPLQFGPMEISCQAFNTIKLWLTWIIYFWTVVSIVDTFFRSEQRTA